MIYIQFKIKKNVQKGFNSSTKPTIWTRKGHTNKPDYHRSPESTSGILYDSRAKKKLDKQKRKTRVRSPKSSWHSWVEKHKQPKGTCMELKVQKKKSVDWMTENPRELLRCRARAVEGAWDSLHFLSFPSLSSKLLVENSIGLLLPEPLIWTQFNQAVELFFLLRSRFCHFGIGSRWKQLT